jgi:hypothetical protein
MDECFSGSRSRRKRSRCDVSKAFDGRGLATSIGTDDDSERLEKFNALLRVGGERPDTTDVHAQEGGHCVVVLFLL